MQARGGHANSNPEPSLCKTTVVSTELLCCWKVNSQCVAPQEFKIGPNHVDISCQIIFKKSKQWKQGYFFVCYVIVVCTPSMKNSSNESIAKPQGI